MLPLYIKAPVHFIAKQSGITTNLDVKMWECMQNTTSSESDLVEFLSFDLYSYH